MDSGKKLEALIKESADLLGIDCTRFRDAGFMRQEKSQHKRFTISNICDFILFDGHRLLYVEAKSGKTSITFDRLKQQKELQKKRDKGYKNVETGYILEIKGRWFWLDSEELEPFKEFTGKKSFNDKDLDQYGFYEIPSFIPDKARKERIDLVALFS